MTQQQEQFESLCVELGITFKPGAAAGAPRIDYWLPNSDLLVELKTWESERLHGQLQSVSGRAVLVLVGPASIDNLREFLVSLRSRSLGEIRYVLTHVVQRGTHEGKRVMLHVRDRRFTFSTAKEAGDYQRLLLAQHSAESANFQWGGTLAVRPVLCEDGGDPVTRFFDE